MTVAPSKKTIFVSLIAISVLLLVVPTIVVVTTAFTSGRIIAFPPRGLSLEWFRALLENRDVHDALFRSFYVATICTIISLPVGTLCALGLVRYRVRMSNLIQVYLLLPLTIPLIVSGIGIMFLFGDIGILGNLWPIGIAACVINLPFMIWAVSASVNALDPDLEDAASNCGADPFQVFFTVTIPAIMPGIFIGAIIMFILGLNEFLVSLLLVNVRIVTLPVLIYTSIRTTISPDVAAISLVYIVIAIAMIWIVERLVGLEIFLRARQ